MKRRTWAFDWCRAFAWTCVLLLGLAPWVAIAAASLLVFSLMGLMASLCAVVAIRIARRQPCGESPESDPAEAQRTRRKEFESQ